MKRPADAELGRLLKWTPIVGPWIAGVKV